MKRILPVAILLMLCASGVARAEFYVGASFLSTDSEFDTAIENFDSDDSGYKIFGGWTFFKFVGLEASYRDMGNQSQVMGTSAVDFDLTAYDLSAKGILPLGMFAIYAKVGFADISTDGTLDLDGFIQNIDDSSTEVLYGIGVDLNIGGHFGVRAEYETYDVSDSLDSISLGAFWRF